MINIVQFGSEVLEKNIFQAFPYILLCKSLNPWGGAMHDPSDIIWTNAKYQCIPACGS